MKNNSLGSEAQLKPNNGFSIGKGKMAALVQSKDWSKTPLGPIESWPQSLRTTVSLCLASNFPISIAWGPQRVQIYNDGYWPICGDKHPASMGQDFKECWLSAWPVIGEAFEQASLGHTRFLENQRIFIDRYGYLEETFFTFSFSPILDESGGVGGLFHPVTELTQQTLAERRLDILRTLAEQAVGSHTVEEASRQILQTLRAFELDLPFVLLYTLSPDGTQANLGGAVGVEAGTAIAPAKVDLETGEHNWPFAKVLESRGPVQVEELAKRFGSFPCGPYPERPTTALTFPVYLPGATNPHSFFVFGVSARRSLDEKCRLFYDLLIAATSNALAKARAYEEEKKRAEALAELDKAKTTFFSNISHEFRTPLTLMLGPLQEVLSDPAYTPESEQHNRLQLVYRNTLRLKRLVNNLLDFSRIEAGRLNATFQATDIGLFTAELAGVFRSAMQKANLDFEISCNTITAPVFIDHEMWEKIVFNLLSNALKFTFTGKVVLSLIQEKDRVLLKVADTGEGITKEELPNLFKRFYRVEGTKSRTHEGSGIGLAFVQELVKLHGGTIKAESEKGKGTTFTVSIPTGYSHLPEDKIVTEKADGSRVSGSNIFIDEALQWSGRATALQGDHDYNHQDEMAEPEEADILVVDDNADMREYVARILSQNRSLKLRGANDGLEALEEIKKRKPNVIISDLMMPQMDGFQLLKILKEDTETATIPVILLSARAGEEATLEGLSKGADDYLIKPFSRLELLARVRTQLEITKTRQDNAKLREAEEELKKFKILSDYAFDPFILMREDGSFAYLNDLALERWGYTREEAQNIRVPDVDPVFHQQKFDETFALAQKQSIPPFETIHKRKDGHIYAVEVSMGGITLKGEPHMFAVARDITDRKKYEETILQSEADLQKKVEQRTSELIQVNKELEQFTYAASHDMQEPLRKVQTFSSMLQKQHIDGLNEKGKTLVSKINSSVNRMKRIIDDLLKYSHQGRNDQKFVAVNVNNIIRDVMEDLELLMQEKGCLVFKDELPELSALPGQINQLFFNLFSNALKFAKTGVPVTIEIRASDATPDELQLKGLNTEQSYYKISFSDNGIGFRQEYAEQIFSLFKRLHGKNEYEGTGIGLGLCKKIVENHKGAIWAESEENKGSTFYIILPH